ncbi:MAG: hypothetical protein M1829_003145 [Trizodia sp. TS-e1964]|nr:MAG: hypothetical protein M1829_003145 [Trizodia sp. TS-e1964]
MVRIKSRYLLAEILHPPLPSSTPSSHATSLLQIHRPAPATLTPALLARHIKDSVHALFGDFGAGLVASNFQVKYFSPATATFIVKAARGHYRLVWAAITALDAVPGVRGVVCCVVRVSGTMRGVMREAVRRAGVLGGRVRGENTEGEAERWLGLVGEGGEGGEEEESEGGSG